MNEVAAQKITSLQRCIAGAREELPKKNRPLRRPPRRLWPLSWSVTSRTISIPRWRTMPPPSLPVGDGGADPPRQRPEPRNLLDCLDPLGMESLVARISSDVIDVNVPRARLALDTLETLLHAAERHALISEQSAAGSREGLRRLRDVLSAL